MKKRESRQKEENNCEILADSESFLERKNKKKLSLEYYQQNDVIFLSRDLLGKVLLTRFDDQLTGGIIVETEAYRAPEDRASHAFGNRRTQRNEVMYHAGGMCYVYKCYGIHSLFNVVTNTSEIPHAILIRAIEPLYGIDVMLKRRNKYKLEPSLTAGPGSLCEALGIETKHNGLSLVSSFIWIEYGDKKVFPEDILATPRVGIDYAGEDALKLWRFRLKNNKWTSRAK
jgi:DNA-3-methyladenine glycosylase